MRAAIYVRLSELTESTTSPDRQRQDCAKIIEAAGWTHDPTVDVYEDLDISAYTGARRPAWNRLLDQLDHYDVLVAWKLDRLYRRFTGFVRIMETLDTHDVRLALATETLDTSSPLGQAAAGLLAAVAEQESANTGARIRSAQQHLRRTGRWRGGKPPYGWQAAPHPDGGRRLALDPDRVPTVLDIVVKLEQGWSARAVANDLNERQVPTWGGARWSGQQVYKMVRNPRMAGWQPHQGDMLRDTDGAPIPGPEPMIDPARWQRLVDRLAHVGADSGGRRTGATMLSGLARCGRCGGPMAGWTGDHPKASYACSRRGDSGATYCPGVSILRRWMDEYVGLRVVREVERWRTMIPDPAPTLDGSPDPVADLVGQLRRLERDRTELGLYDDPESEQVYVARWRDLRGRIARARRQEQDQARRQARPAVDEVAPEDLADAWGKTMSTDEKRQVVRAMVDHVEVGPVRGGMRGKWDPERVRIRWLPGV